MYNNQFIVHLGLFTYLVIFHMLCWPKIGLNHLIVYIVFPRIKKLKTTLGALKSCYSGSIYNIPIGIWILDTHPYNPPMVFVKPTSAMQIKSGRNVDTNGKVDLPYLRDWRYVSQKERERGGREGEREKF